MLFEEEFGLIQLKKGDAIERISSNRLDLSLLASFDGTEVIHHHLQEGSRWVIGPSEGWNALEFIYILSGELHCNLGSNQIILRTGDSAKAIPIKKDCFFKANVETEFLYITSQPVFFHYSEIIQKMKELAISVEEKDGYTADHCQRIMKLSMQLGEKLNISSVEMYHLNLGSFLHDIGKVKVPDHILNKPGKLTAEEWDVIKMHPTYGREILEQTKLPYLLEAATIVEQHHERYNGKGYPLGLRGEQISILSAIVAVVDSYDAMTTDRVYRKGLTKEEAIEELIQGRATLYHPDVVDTFLLIKDDVD